LKIIFLRGFFLKFISGSKKETRYFTVKNHFFISGRQKNNFFRKVFLNFHFIGDFAGNRPADGGMPARFSRRTRLAIFTFRPIMRFPPGG